MVDGLPSALAARGWPQRILLASCVCVICGAPAHYSQRIAGGADQVQVGDTESYEARCRACYEEFQP